MNKPNMNKTNKHEYRNIFGKIMLTSGRWRHLVWFNDSTLFAIDSSSTGKKKKQKRKRFYFYFIIAVLFPH